MDNKRKIIIIIAVIIILGFIFLLKNSFLKDDEYEQLTFNEVVAETPKKSNSEEVDSKIKIHIIGEVNNPGLIELKVGSRIQDAIELAGGLTSEADTSKTNLAYILSDGEKVYIPNINDEENIEAIDSFNSNSKININTASSTELKTIPGVGESTANSIIEYRNKNRKIYFNRRHSKCFRNWSK